MEKEKLWYSYSRVVQFYAAKNDFQYMHHPAKVPLYVWWDEEMASDQGVRKFLQTVECPVVLVCLVGGEEVVDAEEISIEEFRHRVVRLALSRRHHPMMTRGKMLLGVGLISLSGVVVLGLFEAQYLLAAVAFLGCVLAAGVYAYASRRYSLYGNYGWLFRP